MSAKNLTDTERAEFAARQIGLAAANLDSAIDKAIRELQAAKDRLHKGQRPSILMDGTIMRATASEVDAQSAALHALLGVLPALGLTGDAVTKAVIDGASGDW